MKISYPPEMDHKNYDLCCTSDDDKLYSVTKHSVNGFTKIE